MNFNNLSLLSEIVVATDTVWSDLSIYLDGRMSRSAVHTFVYKGRHGIKEKLGFRSSPKIDPPEVISNYSTECGSYYLLFIRIN